MTAAASHPNNLVSAMALAGYGLDDLVPAFPGRTAAEIDRILRDNALALSRPVLPYGLLGIHPCQSRHFNVQPSGNRWIGRDQPWPPRRDRTSLFFFGGSTGLGYNVDDRDAVPALLQDEFDRRGIACDVYNFGSGNYASRHECLRLLALLDDGVVPDLAVFLDGYNDSYQGLGDAKLVEVLDALYQGEKRRRRKGLVAALADYAADRRRLTMPSSANIHHGKDDSLISDAAMAAALQDRDPAALTPHERAVAERVWRKYRDSVAMLRAVMAPRRIRPLFCWQPVPFFATRPEQRIMDKLFRVFPHGALCAPVYHWLHGEGFPGMAEQPDFLDLSRLGEQVDGVLYLDICHYTRRIAERIAVALADRLAPAVAATPTEAV